jgi:hypothetical protein
MPSTSNLASAITAKKAYDHAVEAVVKQFKASEQKLKDVAEALGVPEDEENEEVDQLGHLEWLCSNLSEAVQAHRVYTSLLGELQPAVTFAYEAYLKALRTKKLKDTMKKYPQCGDDIKTCKRSYVAMEEAAGAVRRAEEAAGLKATIRKIVGNNGFMAAFASGINRPEKPKDLYLNSGQEIVDVSSTNSGLLSQTPRGILSLSKGEAKEESEVSGDARSRLVTSMRDVASSFRALDNDYMTSHRLKEDVGSECSYRRDGTVQEPTLCFPAEDHFHPWRDGVAERPLCSFSVILGSKLKPLDFVEANDHETNPEGHLAARMAYMRVLEAGWRPDPDADHEKSCKSMASHLEEVANLLTLNTCDQESTLTQGSLSTKRRRDEGSLDDMPNAKRPSTYTE